MAKNKVNYLDKRVLYGISLTSLMGLYLLRKMQLKKLSKQDKECGIGCDIVYLPRLKIDNQLFLKKVLSDNEYRFYGNLTSEKRKREYLGGRFAAKEAFMKANLMDRQFAYHEIEIMNDDQGKPYLNFANTMVTISHDTDYAIAYVMCK